jgi:hypothetical protein
VNVFPPLPNQLELISDMNRLARSCRALVVGIVAAAATLSMTQVADAAPDKPKVPKEIKVPGGNKVFLVGHATGVQIYTCNGSTWGSATPEATLVGDNGEKITHFAGPNWRAADGSQVVGTRVAGVNVDPTAIDWLLLSATRAPGSADGLLASTTFIQRVATTGGRPPAAEDCNAATAGEVRRVDYTADYYFWEKNGKKPGA